MALYIFRPQIDEKTFIFGLLIGQTNGAINTLIFYARRKLNNKINKTLITINRTSFIKIFSTQYV